MYDSPQGAGGGGGGGGGGGKGPSPGVMSFREEREAYEPFNDIMDRLDGLLIFTSAPEYSDGRAYHIRMQIRTFFRRVSADKQADRFHEIGRLQVELQQFITRVQLYENFKPYFVNPHLAAPGLVARVRAALADLSSGPPGGRTPVQLAEILMQTQIDAGPVVPAPPAASASSTLRPAHRQWEYR